MNRFSKLMVVLAAACVSSLACAELKPWIGEFVYGPETSENTACKLAENIAKERALASVVGENFVVTESQVCRQSSSKKSDGECDYSSNFWSFIDGEIKSVRILKKETQPRLNGTACVVWLEAEIVKPTRKSDPDFDIQATTNQSIYRVGDDFILTVIGTQPAHLAIFNWLPKDKNQVYRLEPQDRSSGPTEGLLRKNTNGQIRFDLKGVALWSEAYKDDTQLYEEWLVVIASKKPYQWLPLYELDKFRERVSALPLEEVSIIRRAYRLSKR